MVNKSIWIIVCILGAVLSSCEANPAHEPGEPVVVGPTVVDTAVVDPVQPLAMTTPAFASPVEEVSFREKLKTLIWGEQDKRTSMMLQSAQASMIPHGPTKLVFHLEEASLFIEFANAGEGEIQALLEQIRVNGVKLPMQRDANHPTNFRGSFAQSVGTASVVQLGDLPPITVERQIPLSYGLASTLQADAPILLIRAQEYGTRLLVPLDEKSVTFEFSEEMERKLPVHYDKTPLAHAEWIDGTHLRIELEDEGHTVDHAEEMMLHFDEWHSLSGNRLQAQEYLHIVRTPPVTWLSAGTGEEVSVGPRDRYYEQLAFSPDRTQAIGVVSLGGPLGDGDGWSWSFVLERFGQPPIVLESVFYSTFDRDYAPIRWLDAHTLTYANYSGLYVYDTNTQTRKSIHAMNGNENQNQSINYAVWDPFRDNAYVLAYTDTRKSSWISKLIFAGQPDPDLDPEVQADFTETAFKSKYAYLDMKVTTTADGVYWTRIEQGIPVTEYVADTGLAYKVPGIVRLAAPDGVYMQRYNAGEGPSTVPASELILKPAGWWFWQPGASGRRIAEPPSHRDVIVSGQRLFAQLDDLSYAQYDPKRDEWTPWQAIGGQPEAEPVRGPDGLYRLFPAP